MFLYVFREDILFNMSSLFYVLDKEYSNYSEGISIVTFYNIRGLLFWELEWNLQFTAIFLKLKKENLVLI